MREPERDKPWLMRATVTAVVTVLVGGALAWASGISREVGVHKTSIMVQAETQKGMKEDLTEVKASQRRIEDKIDRALMERK